MPIFAFCDLKIIVINEYSLPYDFSPSKYENSEIKYENSLMKYENSDFKYENSHLNYKNTINGKRRLILDNYFVGYYVMASHGVTNFFSPNEERMFYLPKNGIAVFDAKNRKFSGVFAKGKDELYYLFLTEYGLKHLRLNQ